MHSSLWPSRWVHRFDGLGQIDQQAKALGDHASVGAGDAVKPAVDGHLVLAHPFAVGPVGVGDLRERGAHELQRLSGLQQLVVAAERLERGGGVVRWCSPGSQISVYESQKAHCLFKYPKTDSKGHGGFKGAAPMALGPWRYAGARIRSRNRVIRSLACRCRNVLASRCAASSPSPRSNLATEKCNIYCTVKIVQTLLSIKPENNLPAPRSLRRKARAARPGSAGTEHALQCPAPEAHDVSGLGQLRRQHDHSVQRTSPIACHKGYPSWATGFDAVPRRDWRACLGVGTPGGRAIVPSANAFAHRVQKAGRKQSGFQNQGR